MLSDPAIWINNLVVGSAVALLAYAAQDHYLGWFDLFEQDLREKLRALRTSSAQLRTYLVLWLFAMLAALVGIGWLLNSIVLGILVAVLLAALPWYIIRRMADARRRKIENQLADAMVTFSSAIRAGLSLTQALDILAGQCPPPVSEEFRQIVNEYNMGKPIERTLTEAKQRLKSENFSLFCAAVLASRKSGGRLNETVDRIAHSVNELQRLERKVDIETAQARKSAIYMALAPFLILTVYYFVDPESTVRLFTTGAGQIILALAVIFDIIAYVWGRFILNPDI